MAQKAVPTRITANQFVLQGTGISIGFSTSSITGKPQLSFKKGRQTLNFTGDQIGQLKTPIGTLITVTIANIPDLSSTTFSFLLPDILLPTAASKQKFRTIGITTVHKTSIAGPVKGVQETYKTTALNGTAQHVVF
jgi:hypothetical protein